MPQISIIDLQYIPKGIEIYFWRIDECITQLITEIKDGSQKLIELNKLNFSIKRKLEWLATRALLQLTPYKAYNILYLSNGQPYLDNCNKYISISHTKSMVAIAISDSPIGIDIERFRTINKNLGNYYLSKNDFNQYVNEENYNEELLNLWTVKEAAYKCYSNKVHFLSDIIVNNKYTTSGHCIYSVIYPDGVSNKCYTFKNDDLIISICH